MSEDPEESVTMFKNMTLRSKFESTRDKLYSTKNRTLTLYGWLLLIGITFIFFNFWFKFNATQSAETKLEHINPKFILPELQNNIDGAGGVTEVPDDPQIEEYKKVLRDNQIRGGPHNLPIYDPNKHPGDKKIAEKHFGAPRPKEFPVEIKYSPGVMCKGDIQLAIMVQTRPQDPGTRNAIRKSWGVYADGKYESIESRRWFTFFVMGHVGGVYDDIIKKEHEKHGDILQGMFPDTPYEQTRKFMVGMKWLNEHTNTCRPKYILKVQDNVYVNMASVLGWLDVKLKGKQDLYIGRLLRKDIPIRKVDDWRYVPERDFGKPFFPNLIEGPVYLFDMVAFEKMNRARRYVTPIALEDAYVGVLAEQAGIVPTHNDHFMMLGKPTSVCHRLKIFFMFKVMPNDHIVIFNGLKEAFKSGECKGMQIRHKDHFDDIVL